MLALKKRPEELTGAGDWLGKKIFGLVPYIGTGGSSTIVDGYVSMRRAGAAARTMLEKAAAARWGVARSDVAAEGGKMLNRVTGETLAYGALAEAAAGLKPDLDIALKPKSAFTMIGTNQPRLDIPAKTRGEAVFGIDVKLPGMLYATVVQSPVFGGTVKAVDQSAAKVVRHLHKVVDLGDAVGVIADSYFYAKKAAGLLDITWTEGTAAGLSSTSISAALGLALESGESYVFEEHGEVDKALAEDVLEAHYETPYLAHACMEPMNCTAIFKDGKAELWSSSQAPLSMKWAADQSVDAPNGVVSNTMLTGGGFGRRIEKDAAVYAMKLAAAMPGRPVKTIWSREEDIQHDMYRPAARAQVRGRLDENGFPAAIDYKVALQSVGQQFSRRNLPFEEDGLSNRGNIEGAVHHPYAFPARRISNAVIDLPIPVGSWRSVGHSNNAFFMESFVDELAHKAGHDPFEYRRRLLAHDARLAKLMDKLGTLSGWAGPAKAGRSRGVAFHPAFRSYVGQVAEISLDSDKGIKIDRVICVIDCGTVVNPDTVKAQMEGSIIFAASALMHGEITLENGRVVQGNFPEYDMMRLGECPEIVVHIMENDEAPGGVGEPAVPPLFAAVTNAIFAANGDRVRSLPLRKHGYSFAV